MVAFNQNTFRAFFLLTTIGFVAADIARYFNDKKEIITLKEFKVYNDEVTNSYSSIGQIPNYNVALQNSIRMYIYPCKNELTYSECLKNQKANPFFFESADKITNETFVLINENLIQLFLFTEEYSYKCSDEFMIMDLCGNYIEIHRNQSSDTLSFFKLTQQLDPRTTRPVFLNIASLCSGEYEVWYVINSRGSKNVACVKPFLLINSNC